MKKKIVYSIVAFVIILSATVLPSFAWSIGYNQEGLPEVHTTTYTYNAVYQASGYFVFYRNYTTLFDPFEDPNGTNTASNSAFQIQLADANGMMMNLFVKIPNNKGYEVTVYDSPYGRFEADVDLDTNIKGISEMRFLPNASYVNPGNLRVLIKVVPTYSVVLDEFSDYVEYGGGSSTIQNLQNQIESLNNQLASKDSVIADKNETIAGLQNNNVLSGLFVGIGDGFAAIVTPLLQISVGGVSLANFIGVFLIIGVILLFVLIIHKIRGA